jgi:hypothetical protein
LAHFADTFTAPKRLQVEKNYLFFLLCFMAPAIQAQEAERRILRGKITADVNFLEGVDVVNARAGTATKTERGGYFALVAKAGDSLMFSSVHFNAKMHVVADTDFNALFFVELEPRPNHLEEVIVGASPTAESLGIVKNVKRYTPAERRLLTAGDFKPVDVIKILGGGMPLDPVFNKISGLTAMRKKEVATERKEVLIEKLENLYERRFLIEKIHIPDNYVGGFLFYLAENDKFAGLVKSGNKPMMDLMLAELAVEYLEIIAVESK